MTFPRTEADLPHPQIAPLPEKDRGAGSGAVNEINRSQSNYSITYDEGLKVGYKWYEAEHKQPLFPFGFGLSYTSFAYSDLQLSGDEVSFTLRNTGALPGTEIPQLYATPPPAAGEPFHHLVGWQRVQLAPNESRRVTIQIDRRAISVFDEKTNTWLFLPGSYTLQAGPSSASLPLETHQSLR